MRKAIAYWLGVKAAKFSHHEVGRAGVDFGVHVYMFVWLTYSIAWILRCVDDYQEGACAFWYQGELA